MVTAHGAGFAWSPANLEVQVGDSVRWEWSVPDGVQGVHMLVQQTPNATTIERLPDGFMSGDTASSSGNMFRGFINVVCFTR